MTQGQEKNEPKELTLKTPILKLADENVKAAVITILKFIYCFSVPIQPFFAPLCDIGTRVFKHFFLPAGTMKKFANRRY